MTDPLIQLTDLSAGYAADRPVLTDFSIDVKRGELVCVVGPSGCGKSTLLSVLSGLRPPLSGAVTIDGEDVYGPGGDELPRLGYVFQEPRLLPWRRVGENISIALRAAGVPTAKHRGIVAEKLERLHIGDLSEAWPLQISGGQRQRVAIARALAIEPLYVLMDEPFSALDELTARALRAELLDVWQATGQTIVFVTHSIREAVYLADRIFIMTTNPGRLFNTIEVALPRPRSVEDTSLLELEASIVRSALAEWERAQGKPAPVPR